VFTIIGINPYSFLVRIALTDPLIIIKTLGLSSPCKNIVSPSLYSLKDSLVQFSIKTLLYSSGYLEKNFNFRRYLSISSNDILLLGEIDSNVFCGLSDDILPTFSDLYRIYSLISSISFSRRRFL
jgi:hypothetical protein